MSAAMPSTAAATTVTVPHGRLPPPRDAAATRKTFFEVWKAFKDDYEHTTKPLVARYRDLDLDAAGWTDREIERGYRSSAALSWGGRIAHATSCACAVCLRKQERARRRAEAAEAAEVARREARDAVRKQLVRRATANAFRSAKQAAAAALGVRPSVDVGTGAQTPLNAADAEWHEALTNEWACPGCYRLGGRVGAACRFPDDPDKHRRKCPRFKEWKKAGKETYATFKSDYVEVRQRASLVATSAS